MAMLGSKRLHIAFMDSRGNDLQTDIDKVVGNTGEHINISENKGETLEELINIV